MSLQISPKYNEFDFQWPLSLEDKIKIFEDQIKGWTLDIADQMVNGKIGEKGERLSEPIQSSHFAALSVVLSYFEMIGKFKLGVDSPKKAFEAGLRDVFPGLTNSSPDILEDIVDIVWKQARCGIYHVGQIGEKFAIALYSDNVFSYYPESPYNFVNSEKNTAISLNVVKLIEIFKSHFEVYITHLQDPLNIDLREKFTFWFDKTQPQLLNRKSVQYIDITPS